MGYTTEFHGKGFKLDRPLSPAEAKYINTLTKTRRMKRSSAVLMEMYKGKHGLPYHFVPTEEMKELVAKLEALDLNVTIESTKDPRKTAEEFYGKDGEYFAKDDGDYGQNRDKSIIDYNTPPGHDEGFSNYEKNRQRIEAGEAQPSLWCHWIMNKDRDTLIFDGGEKFYDYIAWLKYYINRFFIPWGYTLNGELEWEGEDRSDRGKLVVKDNVVSVKTAKVVYEDEDDE